MRKSFPDLARISLLVMFALGLAGCSKQDGSSIFGHWRAERYKVQSLNIPIGPEIVFKEHELHLVEPDIHIPISSISAKGEEVVVDIPAGLGLSFYFEGPDRMYFDVPMGGKIYYQRVKDTQQMAIAGPAPEPRPATAIDPARKLGHADSQPERDATPSPPNLVAASSAVPSFAKMELVRQAEVKMDHDLAEAQALLLQARSIEGEHPLVDYNLAVLRMRQADGEAAIKHLNDAFRHGFRAFSLLDANPDLEPLKSDVRYEALVARYR